MGLDELIAQPEEAKLSVLFKGKPGGGKTSAALSFPGPILYIQCDPNTETVRKHSDATLHRVVVPDWKSFNSHVRPTFRDRKWLSDNGIKTVVIDSWSFLSMLMVDQLSGSDGKMQMQDWGQLLHRQKDTLKELIWLTVPDGEHEAVNVVVTCHTKENTDDEGRIQSIGLSIQGQFKDAMEAYFDYALICENASKNKAVSGKVESSQEFIIHAAPPPKQTTKGGSLPGQMVVPHGGSAYSVLNEHINQ